MSKDNKKIFISYRRSASQYFARAVFQHLSHNGYDVFFDIESVGPGEFERIILNQINARAHFLAIIAPGSLERLKSPNDWLRKEIEYALEHDRNVIPVLHGGFDFALHGNKLTGNLKQLTKIQALQVHDDYFFESMDRLTTRYLQQPFYGEIAETPVEDQKEVTRKIIDAQEEELPSEVDLRKEENAITQSLEKKFNAEKYYNQALEMMNLDKFKEVIRLSSLAIEQNSENLAAYRIRGLAYENLGEHDKAIQDLLLAADIKTPDTSQETAIPQGVSEDINSEKIDVTNDLSKSYVYISYSWGGESEDVAIQVKHALEASDIAVIRDKDILGYKDNIKAFMKQLGKGHAIVAVIGAEYLKKISCMYEMLEISNNGNLEERLFPIVLDNTPIYSLQDRLDLQLYWEEKTKGIKELVDKVHNKEPYLKELEIHLELEKELGRITETLTQINAKSRDSLFQSNYSELVDAVTAQIAR